MPEEIYSIGIDVSKKTLDICFLGAALKPLKEFKIKNPPAGIEKILKEMEGYDLDKSCSFILEATSTSYLLAAFTLQQ